MLDEIGSGVLSNMLGCQSVENGFSYRSTINRTSIRQFIINRHHYCKKYKLDAIGLINKLGL
jgi:hypothetical protein